jgi:hypothetical protein
VRHQDFHVNQQVVKNDHCRKYGLKAIAERLIDVFVTGFSAFFPATKTEKLHAALWNGS